ncbi:terpene synthase [Streptomyces sp. NPDC051211]|uniref:terpene synthase family protein n=1 Tax=Streptomyces sp. NPDC051211 TaxID=3154643 RepID=UPI00344F7195
MSHPLDRRPSPILELRCPFPSRFDSELAEEIDERIAEWAQEIGVFAGALKKFRQFRFGAFAVLVHPDTKDRDRLLLEAQLTTAMFAADDHYCDDESLGADAETAAARLTLISVALDMPLSSPEAEVIHRQVASDPVLRAFRELLVRVTTLGTPTQTGRVRYGIISTLLAMAGENSWRLGHLHPPAWEYLAVRPYNGALSNFSLSDVVDDYELPARDFEAPAVRALSLIASTLIMHVNDLYSKAKEDRTSVGSYSLPRILEAAHATDGLQETVRIHNEQMSRYLDAEAMVMAADPSTELAQYLRGLRNWMRGNLDWHRISGRYD